MARVRTVGVGPDAAPVASDTLAVTRSPLARALPALTELALRNAGEPPTTQPLTVVCDEPELRAAGRRREAAGVAARPFGASG